MSIDQDSPSGSQILSGSHSSLNQSKKSSEISRVYKSASQLYLTRRLAESYEALQPVIHAPKKSQNDRSNDEEPTALAPVALATTSQRIKIWSLYVTLLNSIVELGLDEGRRDFGSKEYGTIVRNVQSGEIWEEVVRDGYQGREGSVDAEVVYNLSNLLLGQAPNQKVNQSRLETYLSSSSLDLDFSNLSRTISNSRRPHMSGTDTPKDLSSRIKILELFTLHVLPRNEEWEYAKTFISNSDILDEERKEAFLQTLQEIEEGNDQDSEPYADVEDDYRNAEESQENNETDAAVTADRGIPPPLQRETSSHRRTSSEVDYGIDQARPNGSAMNSTSNGIATTSKPPPAQATSAPSHPPVGSSLIPTPLPPQSSPSQQTRPTSSKSSKIPSKTSKPKPKPASKPSSNILLRRAQQILLLLRTMSVNISNALTKSPAAILRTVMFVIGMLVMLSRKDLRERLSQIVGLGWGKVRGTVGMGTKVSYI